LLAVGLKEPDSVSESEMVDRTEGRDDVLDTPVRDLDLLESLPVVLRECLALFAIAQVFRS